jgi:hypothetical protein
VSMTNTGWDLITKNDRVSHTTTKLDLSIVNCNRSSTQQVSYVLLFFSLLYCHQILLFKNLGEKYSYHHSTSKTYHENYSTEMKISSLLAYPAAGRMYICLFTPDNVFTDTCEQTLSKILRS